MVNRQSPEFQQVAPYPGPGYGGGQIYGSSSGGSVIRVQRESVGRGEGGGSTSSGSVQGRRKRSGLAQVGRNYIVRLSVIPLHLHLQVEEGSAPSLRRGSRWEEAEYRERERAGSRLEQRGSVVSRQIQVRSSLFPLTFFFCRCDLEVSKVLLEQRVWVRGWATHFLECRIPRRLVELTFLGMKRTKTSSLWLVMGAVAVIRP